MSFSKSWDCWKFMIDKSCGIRFCLYWFQIIFCNKCNPCTLWIKFCFCVCWDWLCVLEGIKISNQCWCVGQEECVSWGVQGHFLGCGVSDQGCDCLVDFLRVSEKTGCSSGFGVNQYKHLCAIFLSLTL